MHTHYQWADIPRALVKQWTAQRPRRSRTIRELDATRPAEPAVCGGPHAFMKPYGGLASVEDRSKLIVFLQSPGTN